MPTRDGQTIVGGTELIHLVPGCKKRQQYYLDTYFRDPLAWNDLPLMNEHQTRFRIPLYINQPQTIENNKTFRNYNLNRQYL